jgi:putative transposase
MDPEHCLNALRYVEQNPVAARLVAYPWDWHWSSAPFHAGMGPQPSILDLDLRPAGTRPDAWQRSLLEPSAAEFRARLHECAARGIALAAPAWAESMERIHGVQLLRRRRGRRRKADSPQEQARRNSHEALPLEPRGLPATSQARCEQQMVQT